MSLEMKPNKDGYQTLLDFQDRSIVPQAFKLKDKHTIYIDHDSCHHVVALDMDIYLIKRKSKPVNIIVEYDSHIQRSQHFIDLGFLV